MSRQAGSRFIRYTEALLKAGVSAKLNDYLPAFKETRMTTEKIKSLFLGSKLTAIGAGGGIFKRTENSPFADLTYSLLK